MPNVFISYVRENAEQVQRLANELKARRIKVWLDKSRIKPGYRWKDAIREAISKGDFFIACFSHEYCSRSKSYMNEELTLATEELRQRPTDRAWFIPVLLSDTHVPDRNIGAGETLRSIQWVELYKDWKEGIRSIVSVIQPDTVGIPQVDFPKLTEESWDFLLRQIAERRCTPFLGPAAGFGVLPHESTLAREWALGYGYDLDSPLELAKVAQFLAKTDPGLPKELVRRAVESASPPNFSESDEPHGVLAALPIPIYMTTNYDDFLEQALRKQNRSPTREFSRWNGAVRNVPSVFDDATFEPTLESPVVFHICGHVQVPRSMVVTQDDYSDLLSACGSDYGLPLRVRVALTSTAPLLVGFYVGDNVLRNLLHLLARHLDINTYRSVEEPRDKRESASRDIQEHIGRCFPYLTGGSGWVSLRQFMGELRLRWERYSNGKQA